MKKRLLSVTMCVIMAVAIMTPLSPLSALADDAEPVLPYLDTRLSFEERAADLVSRMTLAEKQSQMGNTASAIPRLGVKAYQWWREALHGVARDGAATSFPTSLSMASMWDNELMLKIGTIISTEARIKSNGRNGTDLSYWSPTINLARDPRWGRNEETYGEDPFLTAQTGEMFVRGVQGDPSDPYYNDKYLKAVSTIKHYAANNSEFNRHSGSSDMDDKTLRDYYTWTFRRITEKADVQSVMSSYNRINGTPASANTYLLDTLLRKTWGFDGYVVSDCGAIADIYNNHRWVPEGWTRAVTAAEAAAFSVRAGTDLNCGSVYPSQVVNAVNGGLLSQDEVDLALVRLFTARMRTGEFDDPEDVPYRSIPDSALEAPEHLAVSLQASREAPVLLKNANKTLPFDLTKINSIAVVGPLANHCELGDYSGSPTTTVSLKQGLTDYLSKKGYTGTINYFDGITGLNRNQYLMNLLWVQFGGDRRSAITADGMNGMRIENNNNLAYITDYSYCYYKNVDVTALASISVDAAAPAGNEPCVVEVRVGSPDGRMIASMSSAATGGWQTYVTRTTTDINLEGLTGLQDIYLVIRYEKGIEADPAAIEAAAKADAAIVIVGSAYSGSYGALKVAAEEADRGTLRMPCNQDALASAVGKVNPNTAVVMSSVGFHTVDGFIDDVGALIFHSYNGQFQGTAMAEILFGDFNPSGRLPFTWYKSDGDLPNVGDYDLRPHDGTLGRTYWYFEGEPQYPFGYGLSYTSFAYANSSAAVSDDGFVYVKTDVTNAGARAGAEVVQVYVAEPGAGDGVTAKKKLRGFARVELNPSETVTVTIPVDIEDLSVVDAATGRRVIVPGNYDFQIGRSSADIVWKTPLTIQAPAGWNALLKNVTLRGDKVSVKTGFSFGSTLTVVMQDETVLDNSLAAVVYKSSNPSVASVNPETGVVTGTSGGTALITATVTVNGKTMEASYPVAVVDSAYVNDILIDGRSLAGFDADVTSYDCAVPYGSDSVPTIGAVYSNDIMDSMTIVQADAVPGTATVTVTKGELTRVYTVSFGRPPISDDFTSGKVGGQWRIVREVKDDWFVDENGLTIKTRYGDLYQTQNDNKNFFLQPGTGNWTIESTVAYDPLPYQSYQQGGIVSYQDDDNFVKLDVEWLSSAVRVQLGYERNGTWTAVTNASVSMPENQITFRLVREGSKYAGYYSIDGFNFIKVGETSMDLNNVSVGLVANNGTSTSANSINVTFKYFGVNGEVPAKVSVDSLLTSVLVAGYKANIPVSVKTAGVKDPVVNVSLVNDSGETLGAAVADADGYALIRTGQTLAKGSYKIVASIAGSGVKAERQVEVEDINQNIWNVDFADSDGKLLLKFNEPIVFESGTVAINGVLMKDLTVAASSILVNDASYDVKGAVVIKGVKYPRLFPSYTFTFNLTKN